jgi:hypothetical protein
VIQEMAKTLQQVTAKWAQNASGAQGAYVDGINGTTVDPTARAIANEAGYLSGVQASVGLWRQNLAASGMQGWKSAAIAKQGNYSTGIAAGTDKYTRKMQDWLPVIQATGQQAKQMPGATLQQRLQRANYVATTLYNRKRGQ